MAREGTRRFAALDGLRALAVLLVFAHHVDPQVVVGGWLGVDLFFVLSGYLITTLLLGEVAASGRIALGAFYARRFLRLMPALLVLVLVVSVVAKALHVAPLRESLAAVLYLMDVYAPVTGDPGGLLGHTWSLAVEEQFYLVWPFVLLFLVRRRWRATAPILLLALAGVVAGVGTVLATSGFAAYRSPFPHLPELLAGALLACALREGAAWPGRLRSPWIPPAIGVGVGAACFLLDQTAWWMFVGGLVVLAAALVALVANVVTQPAGRAARALSARPLVWLGQRSYGFYLWHYPIVFLTADAVGSPWLVAAISAPLSLLATLASWHLVEQPFLRMKRRFSRPTVADVTAATVATSDAGTIATPA